MADYYGDGRLDLISGSCHCDEGGFYVFRRLKDGGFAPRQRVKPVFPLKDGGFNPRQITPDELQSRLAVADLNGDGKPDLLIGGDRLGTYGVVYGPLAGKDELTVLRMWPEGQEPFAPMRLTTNPVLADWDGDGLPDLILGLGEWTRDGWRSRGVYWCRNVGTERAPKFGKPQLLVADKDNWRATGICVADWNGDGRPDLIASRIERSKEGGARPWHQKVWVYLRRGG